MQLSNNERHIRHQVPLSATQRLTRFIRGNMQSEARRFIVIQDCRPRVDWRPRVRYLTTCQYCAHSAALGFAASEEEE